MLNWYQHLRTLAGRAAGSPAPSTRGRRPTFRPKVEGLEERSLPSSVPAVGPGPLTIAEGKSHAGTRIGTMLDPDPGFEGSSYPTSRSGDIKWTDSEGSHDVQVIILPRRARPGKPREVDVVLKNDALGVDPGSHGVSLVIHDTIFSPGEYGPFSPHTHEVVTPTILKVTPKPKKQKPPKGDNGHHTQYGTGQSQTYYAVLGHVTQDPVGLVGGLGG